MGLDTNVVQSRSAILVNQPLDSWFVTSELTNLNLPTGREAVNFSRSV